MPTNTATGYALNVSAVGVVGSFMGMPLDVLNVGEVGVIGSFMGMPLDALILGAFAGAVMHGLNRAGTKRHGIATIITSTLLAGAFSPAIIGYLIHHMHFAEEGARLEMLKPLVPVLIGASWPWLLPLVSDGLKDVWSAFVGRVIKFIDWSHKK